MQKRITSSISADAIAQCNITNLERCKVYDILARFYRGDQVLDMVYDVGSVMTSKLGMATCRPCMTLQTIHLSLIWRLPTAQNFVTHTKQFPNLLQILYERVLPRMFIQCKPTRGVFYMYTHAANQLLLL